MAILWQHGNWLFSRGRKNLSQLFEARRDAGDGNKVHHNLDLCLLFSLSSPSILSYFQEVCIQIWKMLASMTAMNIRAVQSFKGDIWLRWHVDQKTPLKFFNEALWLLISKCSSCSSQSWPKKTGLCGCEALIKKAPFIELRWPVQPNWHRTKYDEPVALQRPLMRVETVLPRDSVKLWSEGFDLQAIRSNHVFPLTPLNWINLFTLALRIKLAHLPLDWNILYTCNGGLSNRPCQSNGWVNQIQVSN